jgi:homoserine O-acetyltransferase/O-succinyltransferase
MGLCQQFYSKEAWREVGFTSLEDFLHRFWEAYFLPMDPNNLIWMAWKWRHGDVSRHTNGDLAAALGRIKAKTLVVPFSYDMFFPPEPSRSSSPTASSGSSTAFGRTSRCSA